MIGFGPKVKMWAAACGEVSMNAMILPAALYFWQLPHFMALAYLCRNDYIAGGFQMLSFADPSGRRTALVSFRNSVYLLPLGFLAYDWGMTSEWFTLESSLLTLCMTGTAVLFVNDRTKTNARRMFHASLLYLPVFMAGLLLHRRPNDQREPMLAGLSGSEGHTLISGSEVLLEDNSRRSRKTRDGTHGASPPVAFASVAPFPFLPAPLYVSPDL